MMREGLACDEAGVSGRPRLIDVVRHHVDRARQWQRRGSNEAAPFHNDRLSFVRIVSHVGGFLLSAEHCGVTHGHGVCARLDLRDLYGRGPRIEMRSSH